MTDPHHRPHRIGPASFAASFAMGVLLLPLAGATADLKVACVGNSITYGYGLNSPYYESYPTQLDTLLGAGYTTSNFGVSSQTMLKASNASYWKQSAFTSARAYLPNLVVIELGTNDAKDDIWPSLHQNFKADYISMIDTFRILSTHPQVWTTLQPPAQNAGWRMYDTTIVRQVNPAILAVALQKAAPVIDLHTAMSGHPQWFQSDTVHPTAAGAKELAKIVAAMLLHAPITISSSAGTLTATKGFGYQWYRNDSLLAGATSQSLASPVPGAYKVSVKIDSLGQSRLVSASISVTSSATGIPVDRRSVHLVLGPSGRVRVLGLPASLDAQLVLRNTRGETVANERLRPGVYSWTISTPGAQCSGKMAILP